MPLAKDDEQVARLAHAVKDFGVRLLAHLATESPEANSSISPFSIAIALAMLWNGAEGATRQIMSEVLGWSGWEREDVNTASASLQSLQKYLGSGLRLLSANSLWVAQDIGLNPEFVERLRQYYAGDVVAVAFSLPENAAERINRWIAEKTEGKIDRLVTPLTLLGAILVLVNSVYFKALWAQPFDETLTRQATFRRLDGTSKIVPLMRNLGRYPYFDDGEVQAVSLPYAGAAFSMDLILPREATAFREFRQRLTVERWRACVESMEERSGMVALPRFRAESTFELNDSLIALGMGVAFTSGAEFGGVGAGPLFISRVLHQVLVEVNEEGTEAAAATIVVMTRSMVDHFKITFDRPFFCAIRHVRTGAALFMGFVMDPK